MKTAGAFLLIAATVAITAILPAASQAHHDRRESWTRRDDDGWRRAKQRRYGAIHYVSVRQRQALILRPDREERFVVRGKRGLAIRPVPYWYVPYRPAVAAVVGVRTRHVQFDLAFRERRPYYGCNFCSGYFPTYVAWQRHVDGCRHRPRVQIVFETWADDDLDYFCEPAVYECSHYDGHWDDWDGGNQDDGEHEHEHDD